MKRYVYITLAAIFIILGSLVLNSTVSTQQCINYQCHALQMPLYLKILDFFNRHYNYKHLVRVITASANTDEERVMKIFEWTYRNIKRVPPGLPVIDDHIWYTIVRGYGAGDQFSDILTTFCNHAGIEAFFTEIPSSQHRRRSITFSFIKIRKKWTVFDPYYGVYFKDKDDTFAGIDTLRSGDWRLESLNAQEEIEIDYADYFANLPTLRNIGLNRANIQSPLNRLLFEIKRRF